MRGCIDTHVRSKLAVAIAAAMLCLSAGVAPCTAAGAQQSLTRAQAVEAALSRGPRLAVSGADTLAAVGALIAAGAFPNPGLSASFSKDAPQYHVLADIPLDFGGIRSTRVRSAEFTRQAAILRFAYARAAIVFDADTTYTRALAAAAHAQLSRRNAIGADSLRRIAAIRRDAGDASDLDVELATVNAGEQENLAVADSLALIGTLLDLQTVIGMSSSDRAVAVVLSDSLGAPPDEDGSTSGAPLQVAAAEAALSAATYATRLQHRSIWPWPSLQAGFDAHDPGGSEKGLLPTVGLSIPLPLLNRNRGLILSATADEARARAELEVSRLESSAQINRSLRERDVAIGKLNRDRQLIVSADRVVAMSIRAYQEGASPLANVLEAQRTARDVLGQYIDDVAAAWIATSAVHLYLLAAHP